MDLDIFRLISGDEEVQDPYEVAALKLDSLSRPDVNWHKSVGKGTDEVGGDHANQVHHPCVAVQAEDIFLGIPDVERRLLFYCIALARKTEPMLVLARSVWRTLAFLELLAPVLESALVGQIVGADEWFVILNSFVSVLLQWPSICNIGWWYYSILKPDFCDWRCIFCYWNTVFGVAWSLLVN